MTSKPCGLLLALTLVTASALAGAATDPRLDEYAALDRLTAAGNPVQLRFHETSLARVLEAMGRATGVDMDLAALPETRVSVDTGQVTLKAALVQLARENNLVYEVIGTDKLVVRLKGKTLG